jgi:hypothetical protein
MIARQPRVLLACVLVAHASVAPALADGKDAPAAIPLAPPGLVMAVEPPAEPASVQPWRAPENAGKASGWYGDHILLMDAIAAVVINLGVRQEHGHLVLVGAGTMLLGGPIMHIAHGERDALLRSIPLRIVLPISGAALGLYAPEYCRWGCYGVNPERIVLGLGLGMAAASIIDAAFLARPRARSRDARALTWTPQLGAAGKNVSAGIGGSF